MEILIVLSSFALLVTIVFGIYQWLLRINQNINVQQFLIEETHHTVERLHTLIQDFTVDYEEYRNRRVIGCNSDDLIRDTQIYGYCDRFTHYGNANPNNDQHLLYYCSSDAGQSGPLMQAGQPTSNNCLIPWPQSFGQYAEHFRNKIEWQDAIDVWIGPAAIMDPDNVAELYLISLDDTRRLFVRRALVQTWDDGQQRYTLQILRLQWLDVWSNHDFALGDETVYDGQIDTWACDTAEWFFCQGANIGSIYTWFRIPQDQNDGRVDFVNDRLNVLDRRLQIYPTKNPDYARAEPSMQIQPYIRIYIRTAPYGPSWPALSTEQLEDFHFSVQTMFNTRSQYVR